MTSCDDDIDGVSAAETCWLESRLLNFLVSAMSRPSTYVEDNGLINYHWTRVDKVQGAQSTKGPRVPDTAGENVPGILGPLHSGPLDLVDFCPMVVTYRGGAHLDILSRGPRVPSYATG